MGDVQLKDTLRHLVSVIVTLSQGMVLASPIEVQGILKQGAAVLSANNFLLGVLESSTTVFGRFGGPVSFFLCHGAAIGPWASDKSRSSLGLSWAGEGA